MLSVGHCGVARLQMKVGHMDGVHCFIDSISILVKIKSVSLYNCRTVYLDLPETQDLAQRSSFASIEKIQGDTMAAIPKADLQRRLQQWQDHWSKCVVTCRTALFRG